MPRSLPLATPCDHTPCGHPWSAHDESDAAAPCWVRGCGCARFEGPSPSSPLVAGARDSQVGGDHYAKHTIQPWDIWEAYGLNAFEGAVIKYVLRHRDKNGVEDLKKARHTLDRLIEIEERKARE